MTVTATTTFTPIPSDFYGMEAKLADRETADRLKGYWTERLEALAGQVGTRD